jgi:hypothetical protein
LEKAIIQIRYADIVTRKEQHTMIDAIPEQSLPVLKPLLDFLSNDYWRPVIEQGSPEEIAMIGERMKDYKSDLYKFCAIKELVCIKETS